jgi:hypothetical protein
MRMVGRIMIARAARGAFSAPPSELRISARTPSIRATMPATYPSRHARVVDLLNAFKTSIFPQVAAAQTTISKLVSSNGSVSRERKAVRNAAAAALRRNTVAAAAVAARPSARQKKPVHSRRHTPS